MRFTSSDQQDAGWIGFRPLCTEDLPLLHRWLNTDHVMEWWGKAGASYEQVVAEYSPPINGEESTSCFVITRGAGPIGYIQVYMLRDYPEHSAYFGVDEDAAGVDLFIGEAEYLHRGLGSKIIRKFLREVVFGQMNAGSCIIDPEPANRIAIRAYEKAGFKYIKTVKVPAEAQPAYLMRVSRGDFFGGQADVD